MNQYKRPTQGMIRRSFCVLVVFLFVLFSFDIKSLAELQLIRSDEFKAKAEQTQLSDTEIQAQRGSIYDKNGKPLARSASVWKVYIRPAALRNLKNETVKKAVTDMILNELSGILGIEKEEMQENIDSQYGYVVIKRRLEKEEKDKVSDFLSRNAKYSYTTQNSKGETVEVSKDTTIGNIIGFDPDVKRYYPNNNLASSVLGVVGSGGSGISGIESYYDKELSGVPEEL